MKVTRHTPESGAQMVLEVEGRGSLGLWWEGVPKFEGCRMGCVGAFDVSDPETSQCLLDEACRLLAERGCQLVVGPMDGNTWRSHRFVVHEGDRPAFFLEPSNPAEWPGWWETAGFEVLSGYSSSRFELCGETRDFSRVESRLRNADVSIRPLRINDFEDELRRIHHVCLEAFSKNFLYTPLSEAEFVAMYGKVREMMSEEFAWVAEADCGVCGFVFGLPDVLATQRGEKADFIVKTLAVLPQRRFAGLGSLLVERVQQSARRAGFAHAIHALQHDSNSSLRITKRSGGQLIRRYALYSKTLRS